MKAGKLSMPAVFALLTIMFGIAAYPAAAAEKYELDPVHTSVIFRVKHFGASYVYGSVWGATGSFRFDASSPSNNMIEMAVKAGNVDTGVEKRDKHIKSPDFFNAGEFPMMSFKSKSVKKTAKNIYEISGDLTLLGKTNPVSVKAQDTGSGKDPWGNFRRGFETSFTIKRSDYGMDYMLGGLSDEVMITVSIEGIRH